ncbi:MAG: hypothetical protein ABGX16_19695 [Pirellulales bacterium]
MAACTGWLSVPDRQPVSDLTQGLRSVIQAPGALKTSASDQTRAVAEILRSKNDPQLETSQPTTAKGPIAEVDTQEVDTSAITRPLPTEADLPPKTSPEHHQLQAVREVPATVQSPHVTKSSPSIYQVASAHHTIRLAEIDSRMSIAQTVRAIVDYQVKQARKLAAIQLQLVMSKIEVEKYEQGVALMQQTKLKNEVVLAAERLEQSNHRLQWSYKLANQGQISQHALKLDKATATATSLSLNAAEDRLRVYQGLTHSRKKFELAMDVNDAQLELEYIERVGEASVQELQTKQRLKLKEHDRIVNQVDVLKNRLVDLTGGEKPHQLADAPIEDSQLVRQSDSVELAQAHLQRVRTETDAERQRLEGRIEASKNLLSVAHVVLDEWLKGMAAQEHHQKLAKIRNSTAALDAAQQQMRWAERVVQKGYITSTELAANELAVREKNAALEQAKHELAIFDNYTQRSENRKLRAQVTEAEQEIGRRQQLLEAAKEESTTAVLALKEAWKLEQQWLDQLLVTTGGQVMNVVK